MSANPAPKPFRALLVWPKFPNSFWSMQATIEAVGRKASLPPLGLVTVAAMCPPHWELKLVDEAVEPLTDDQIRWADLVMVSAMEIQSKAVAEVLQRSRQLGRRTVIGGPYASSHTEELLALADHVVTGEVEDDFSEVAAALESGKAPPLFAFTGKPDVTTTPRPRFDLLKLDAYAAMSVQFSRGCPFQCEFCDIIVLYGRKPRTKTPEQLTSELDHLLELGWRGEVFLVDDNFIGNHVKAQALLDHMKEWQKRNDYPMAFYTEASVNLASRKDLIDAMVAANFQYVFLGIETPSGASLQETRKFQNTRQSLVDSVHTLQENGLWVMGGFIVGFDADEADIFQRQLDFVEAAAIPWAMVGMLQALRHTALSDRLRKEGRMYTQTSSTGNNLSMPNFRTTMSRTVMVRGYCDLIEKLYSPKNYFARAMRSLALWRTRETQKPPKISWRFKLAGVLGGIWHLGIKSDFRLIFWKSLAELVLRYWRDDAKMYHGYSVLVTGLHMTTYARSLVSQYRAADIVDDPEPALVAKP